LSSEGGQKDVGGEPYRHGEEELNYLYEHVDNSTGRSPKKTSHAAAVKHARTHDPIEKEGNDRLIKIYLRKKLFTEEK